MLLLNATTVKDINVMVRFSEEKRTVTLQGDGGNNGGKIDTVQKSECDVYHG